MGESGVDSPHTKENDTASEAGESSQKDPLVFTVFDKRYEIQSLLGTGATSTVYKANDILLSRQVAVKIIHKHLLSSENAVDRFKAEAHICTALSHPHIARVYNMAVAADGRLYMVLDFLEGDSLALLLSRQGKLELAEFFDLFLPLADALSYAHQQHIIHRDIKPNNIILTIDSGVRKAVLADFGLAKCLDEGSESQGVTKTGVMLGSSAYMSPEQCLGKQDIDARSDIYSLGCVMLEALLGTTPFQGESAFDIMYKHINSTEVCDMLKVLPQPIEDILKKCLQKNPADRYQSMSELKNALSKCSDMKDTLQRRWNVNLESKPQKKFNAAAFAALFLFAGLSIFLLLKVAPHQQEKEIQELNMPSSNTDKLLPPPEEARIPLRARDLEGLIGKYLKKMGPKAVIKILDSWEQKHSKNASPEDKVNVLAEYSRAYSFIPQPQVAEDYAEQVYKNHMPAMSAYVTSTLVDMYNTMARPDKSLAVIAKMYRYQDNSDFSADDAIDLLSREGQCYLQTGDSARAAELLYAAAEKAEKYIDPGRAHAYVSWHRGLVTALCLQGKSAQLEKAIAFSRACAEASNTPNLALAELYWNVGFGYADAGNIEQANKSFQICGDYFAKAGEAKGVRDCKSIRASNLRSLRQYQRAFDIEKEIPPVCTEWAQKAQSYQLQSSDCTMLKRYADAYKYGEMSLSICDQHLKEAGQNLSSERDGQIIMTVGQLGEVYRRENKLKEVNQLYETWLSKINAIAGEGVTLANLYFVYGTVLNQTRQCAKAIECAEKSIQILKSPKLSNLSGDAHAGVMIMMADNYLLEASVYSSIEKQDKAIDACMKSISSLADVPRKETNTKMLETCLQLASCCSKAKKIDEAAKWYAKAEELWPLVHPTWNPNAAVELANIANFKSDRKDFLGAEKIYRRCVDGLKASNPGEVPELAWFYSGLADALVNQNKLHEALVPLQKSQAMCRKLGKVDFFKVHTLYQIYQIDVTLHEYKKAEQILPELATNLKEFADIQMDANQPDEAEKYFADSLKCYEGLGAAGKTGKVELLKDWLAACQKSKNEARAASLRKALNDLHSS